MNTLLGREGAGCAEIPSYEELDDLKADAAKLKGISLRYITFVPQPYTTVH